MSNTDDTPLLQLKRKQPVTDDGTNSLDVGHASDAKTMMPEVLPRPQRATLRSTPRQRALKRLKKLTATIGTTAAAANLASCIGFGVVDPLPEPTFCSDFSAGELAQGSATRVDADTFSVDLFVGTPFGGPSEGIEFRREDIRIEGGTISNGESFSSFSVRFDVTPDAGVEAFQVIIPVGCDGADYVLTFTISTALEVNNSIQLLDADVQT